VAPAGEATAPTDTSGPVAAVIAPVDGSRTSRAGSAAGSGAGGGTSPALLVAAMILGALAGLAVVQLLLRRRRA
jgi:hypothetical protein